MKTYLAVICLAVAFAAARPGIAQSPDKSLDKSLETSGFAPRFGTIVSATKPADDSAPARTLDELERIALEENPAIHVAARKAAMAEAHVATTGKLDDPQLMYRGWQVPLNKPWDYNAAENMVMLGRSFTASGKRTLETSIAKSDVTEAKDELEAERLRVRVELRKAFFDLLLAQEELKIHDQHVAIARQAMEAARIKYTVGKVPEQDVLKAQLALTRLEEHLVRFERDAEVAQARMNTLLGREPETPIRVVGEFGIDTVLPAENQLRALAVASRPDLKEAEDAAEKSRTEQALAKKAYVPDFSVNGGYMLMGSGSNPRNNYMLEGSMTLPWLNRHKHDAEIAESAANASEQDAEVDAVRNEAFGQIEEALAEARASQRLARVYHDSLEPQAEATLHAAVIAYENNQTDLLDLLDSQMAVIDVNLSWIQSMNDFARSRAELEMATGAPVEDAAQQPAAQKEKQ